MDSTGAERQKRRLQRMAGEGLKPTSVVVHAKCKEVLQELRPYLADPARGQQLMLHLQDLRSLSPQPTNVSQVAQLSPLRYPGGKTWLVPQVRQWLRSGTRPKLFVEPFAGGAITGLSVAAESLANAVCLAELDPSVAALWSLLIHGSDLEADTLFDRILGFEMSAANVDIALADRAASGADQAFCTILKNRVNRGGILAPGASRMKAGENGKGLASRWYPQTLVNRMRAVRCMRQRLEFIEGDAFAVIARYRARKQVAWFIDPPYTAGGKRAGSRLYAFSEIDHERLFSEMSRCTGRVMMTYDDAPEVRELALRFGFEICEVPMKTTHHEVKNELLLLKG